MHKLSDVSIDSSKLLKKGYNAMDLVGRVITVHDVSVVKGEKDDYISCVISGDDIEEGKPLNTGSHNISVKLLSAKEQDKLPVEVTIGYLGGNALDIT